MGTLPFIQRAVALEREILDRVVKTQQGLSELEGRKAQFVAQVADAAASLTDIQERRDALSTSLDEAVDAVKIVGKASEKILHESLEEIRRGEGIIEDMQLVAHSMGQQLVVARKEVLDLLDTKERVLTEMKSAQALIAKRRAELDAFEAFIKEVYDKELFPLSAFNL